MADSFRIDVDLTRFNIDSELEGYLKKVDAEMAASSNAIESSAATRVPVNLGGLKSVIQAKKIGPLSYEVVAPVAYAPAIEFGTGKSVKVPAGFEALASQFIGLPGIRQGNFADMVLALFEWGKKHGFNFKEPKDATFLASSILRKGIKPQPYLIPAFIFEQEQLMKRLNAIK